MKTQLALPTARTLSDPALRLAFAARLNSLLPDVRREAAILLLAEGAKEYIEASYNLSALHAVLKQAKAITLKDLQTRDPQTLLLIKECNLKYERNKMILLRSAIEELWGAGWSSTLKYRQEPSNCKLLKCILDVAEAFPDLQHALLLLESIKSARMKSGGPVHNRSDGFFLIDFEKMIDRSTNDEKSGKSMTRRGQRAVNSVQGSKQPKRPRKEPSGGCAGSQSDNDKGNSGSDARGDRAAGDRAEAAAGLDKGSRQQPLWPHLDENCKTHVGYTMHTTDSNPMANGYKNVLQEHLSQATVITLSFSLLDIQRNRAPLKESQVQPEEWEDAITQFDKAVSELTKIEGSAVIKSSDDHVLAYKFSGILADHLQIRRAWQQLQQSYITRANVPQPCHGLPQPSSCDHRHHNHTEMLRRYGKFDCGVLHLCHWIPQNQRHPVLSSDCGSSTLLQSVAQFFSAIEPLQKKINAIFQVLEPAAFERYKSSMDRARANDFSAGIFGPEAAFHSTALVHNLRVLPHLDSGDDGSGFVAMTPMGEFTGGDLLVGCDGHIVRMAYRPDDLILFRSAILRHAVGHFEGTRTAMVLFSHQVDMEYNWPQDESQPDYEREHVLHQATMERYRTEIED